MSRLQQPMRAVVLIADQWSFSATYLVHAFTLLGCEVIGPFNSREALDTVLSRNERPFTGAILAMDWLERGHEPVLMRMHELNVPYLLVDNAPWRHLATVSASFTWPYAAFQIVEALQNVMAPSEGAS